MLSEEGKDDRVRLQRDRVWIIDPLDGTREFSEPPRDDWAVHVALWEAGDLVAGAVAQPALGPDLPHRCPGRAPAAERGPSADRGLAQPVRPSSWPVSSSRSAPSWCPWAPPGSR